MSKDFVVNDFLSLKLENGKTVIYVNGKKFIQCKYLLIDIPFEQADEIAAVFNIDNLIEDENELNYHDYVNKINPELEFWGHCSNLQVWYEYRYDTRLLHRNLAFPLLKKLTEVRDPLARMVFKEELTNRFISGNPNVVTYLLEEGFLRFFTQEEFQILLENINTTQIIDQNPELLFLLLNRLDMLRLEEISKIKWFEELKKIRELSIESKRLTNFNGLEEFTSLEALSLNDNNLTELQGLDSLIKLKKLNLNRNKIIKMKGIENLKELKELYLWNNRIKEISGLENLKKLERLSLGGNQIKEISGLENLKNLKFLDLSYNQLSDLKVLIDLQNLQILYIQNNKLTEINVLNRLRNLREIKISYNMVPEKLIDRLRALNINILIE
ncbi:MAG: leucine-rich repeat domain-containing protein [Candidatus Lokiarchaeia archaeon]